MTESLVEISEFCKSLEALNRRYLAETQPMRKDYDDWLDEMVHLQGCDQPCSATVEESISRLGSIFDIYVAYKRDEQLICKEFSERTLSPYFSRMGEKLRYDCLATVIVELWDATFYEIDPLALFEEDLIGSDLLRVCDDKNLLSAIDKRSPGCADDIRILLKNGNCFNLWAKELP